MKENSSELSGRSEVRGVHGCKCTPFWHLVVYFCIHGMQQQQPGTVTHSHISSLELLRDIQFGLLAIKQLTTIASLLKPLHLKEPPLFMSSRINGCSRTTPIFLTTLTSSFEFLDSPMELNWEIMYRRLFVSIMTQDQTCN